jgi:hypothetical protein
MIEGNLFSLKALSSFFLEQCVQCFLTINAMIFFQGVFSLIYVTIDEEKNEEKK